MKKIATFTLGLMSIFIAYPVYAEVSATNDTTGYNSSNTSSVTIENNISYDLDNTANANNLLNISVNTGNNSASYNTGSGNIETGDVDVQFDFVNNIDPQSVDLPQIGAFGGGSSSNENTGANSENNATISVKNKYNIDVDNDLNTDNKVVIDVNTGNNRADYNTGDGSIKTGKVTINGKIENNLGKGGGDFPIIPGDVDDPDENDNNSTNQTNPLGRGGGLFEFPNELPRAGQSVLALIVLSIATGSLVYGLKRMKPKKVIA